MTTNRDDHLRPSTDLGLDATNTARDGNARVYDADTTTSTYGNDRRSGSNFLAFLIGGLVIAVGLLAFLFYDGGSRDVNTTGSTTSIERPATGSTGTGTTTTAPSATTAPPATPTSPTRPANPQ